MISLTQLELLLSCIAVTHVSIESATISVALFNSIPDLNEDNLSSYKKLVETEFQKGSPDHIVQVAVDQNEYDPYSSNLKEYLNKFDIIEIDAVTLGELVNPANPLVMSLDEMDVGGNIKEDIFPAAVQAMTVSETTYGYPTLLCGNFITSIGPVTTEKCPINKGVASQSEYQTALETCATNFGNSQEDFKTLLFGKMSDVYGWYLPYLYLDGYIDTKGDSSLEQAVEDLKHGTVDSDVCENLRWFFGLCDNSDTGKNKCKDGTVSSSEVPSSVVDKESVLMFSFSETLAKVLKKADDRNRGPQSLASVSLGNQNLLLQFTDGLVVSRKRWMEHADDKKDAITQFMKFFTSSTFRYKLAYGVDLNKPQVRYLLMPNKDFYEAPSPAAYDPIYSHARKFLSTALPAPLLENKSEIQKVLNDKCLHITVSAKEQNRDSPKRKNEL